MPGTPGATWDAALFVGGLVPALVFGVAFGNVLQGVPFRFDDMLRMTYTGTLFGPVQPVRAAVRPGQRGDDRHAWRGLAGLQDRGRAAAAGAARRQRSPALALVVLFAAGRASGRRSCDGYVVQHFAGVSMRRPIR